MTSAFLNKLTPDDVPDKWKGQKTTKETDNNVVQDYSRDGVKVLEVRWSKGWKGDKEKMFVAIVCRGAKHLARIVRLGDHISVMASEAPKDYEVFTSIKDDGTVTVNVTTDDSSFFESIVVQGRETHILDDLEYTKTALTMEKIVKPLTDAFLDGIDKKPKKEEKPK